MFAASDTASTKKGTLALSSTRYQMRKTTFVQKAHGRTPSSGGGVVRLRQLYQTMFAINETTTAITAGQKKRDSLLNGWKNRSMKCWGSNGMDWLY